MGRTVQGSFGQLVKHYRVATGLTQEVLAERSGVSARALAYVERGTRMPYPETARRLVNGLALPPEQQADLVAAMALPEAGRRTTSATRPPGTELPLVGREGEIALLTQHLAGEGPPLLLLDGEPGIGKSRLLREAAKQATSQGWTVLHGGCQRQGGQMPYAPILGAIQAYLQSRPPGQLRLELRGCAWLVRLLPELADGPIEPLPTWKLPPEQERRHVQQGNRAFCRFLCTARSGADPPR